MRHFSFSSDILRNQLLLNANITMGTVTKEPSPLLWFCIWLPAGGAQSSASRNCTSAALRGFAAARMFICSRSGEVVLTTANTFMGLLKK